MRPLTKLSASSSLTLVLTLVILALVVHTARAGPTPLVRDDLPASKGASKPGQPAGQGSRRDKEKEEASSSSHKFSRRNLINTDQGFFVEQDMDKYACGFADVDDGELAALCPRENERPPRRSDDRHWDWKFAAVSPTGFPDQITAELSYLVNGTLCSHDPARRDFTFEMQVAVTASFRQCDVSWGFEGPNIKPLEGSGGGGSGGEGEGEGGLRWIDTFRAEDYMRAPRPGRPAQWGKFVQDKCVVPESKRSEQRGRGSPYCPNGGGNVLRLRVECPYFPTFPRGVLAFKRPRLSGPDWYP